MIFEEKSIRSFSVIKNFVNPESAVDKSIYESGRDMRTCVFLIHASTEWALNIIFEGRQQLEKIAYDFVLNVFYRFLQAFLVP